MLPTVSRYIHSSLLYSLNLILTDSYNIEKYLGEGFKSLENLKL